jgi:pimeloyl-ACP methyl ester carboxylesterase
MKDWISNNKLASFVIAGLVGVVAILVSRNPAGQEFEDDTTSREIVVVDDSNDKNLAMLRAGIDSESRPFNAPVTLHLAELCHAVYSNPETTMPKLFFDLRFDSVRSIGDGTNKAVVAIKGDTSIVVFRGTDEIRDWLTNFDVRNVSLDHGNVHSGFWNAYQELRSDIVSALNEHQPKHIWVTGHSLGGAMAVCCAYDLEQTSELRINGLVTFGQPKLGDAKFAEHVDTVFLGRYFAFSNDNDPVVDLVPLCESCGSAIWFNRSKIMRSPRKRVSTGATYGNSGSNEDNEFSLEVMSLDEFQKLRKKILAEKRPKETSSGQIVVGSSLPIIRDHDMANYIDKLRIHFGRLPLR